ncbi:MAG: glycosyltransferase family 4 protein [Halioglobus sp.]|nr:glycosyltransferase family 4 protein [Halioglobus sp.]
MPTEDKRKKILLITRNLPPLLGGMERMMYEFAVGLAEYSELTVIGPRGCRQTLPDNITVLEASPGLAPFLVFSTTQALRACRRRGFDTVIGGSGLIGPTLRILSALFQCKTVVYLHGLDLVVDNAVYQRIFTRSLRGIDSVAVNSVNTCSLAINRGIAEERIAVVNPGTHLPAPIDSASRQAFRQQYSIPFERYLVFTGRMTKRKGLSGFLRDIFPLILQREGDIGLVVVGENPADSLNRLGEEAEINKQITALHLQDKVTFLGRVPDRDLEICLAEAAVQVFPLTEVPGDIEGFGMVAIEAAACGTPTIAFELGGVSDAISAGNGHLVPPGDAGAFAGQVVSTLRTGEPGPEQCLAHARQFTWQVYNERMRRLIDRPGNCSSENR